MKMNRIEPVIGCLEHTAAGSVFTVIEPQQGKSHKHTEPAHCEQAERRRQPTDDIESAYHRKDGGRPRLVFPAHAEAKHPKNADPSPIRREGQHTTGKDKPHPHPQREPFLFSER